MNDFSLQVVGGTLMVIMLPLVATSNQSASYVFTKFEMSSSTGITSPVYGVLLSWLVSQYSLFGYDSAAHLTEETRGADVNGPIAILSSIAMISVFGWGFILALTFSIKVDSFLHSNFSIAFWGCISGIVLSTHGESFVQILNRKPLSAGRQNKEMFTEVESHHVVSPSDFISALVYWLCP